MNIGIVVAILQAGGQICSELIRLRPIRLQEKMPPPAPAIAPAALPAEGTGEDEIKKGTACLPCTNSHLHACAGLLDEAKRMSPDGLNTESMVRVDKCLREIAAAERVDLAAENVAGLPPEERLIAEEAAKGLRDIRHGLEGLSSVAQLEELTLKTNSLQKSIGGQWFKLRLAKMDPEEKSILLKKTLEKIEKGD